MIKQLLPLNQDSCCGKMEQGASHKKEKRIPGYVLDDITSRFMIDVKAEDTHSAVRIFFEIEAAYWFYLDCHCAANKGLKELTMKEFTFAYVNHVPELQKFIAEFEKHFENWKSYKRTIGTHGAILIDKTMKNVLLVQSYGGKNIWGFPKGKKNKGESSDDCAVREVLEETGFDIRPHMDTDEYLEKHFNEQQCRLFLVPDVPLDTVFLPKTRREIKDIQWFPLEMLLNSKGPESSLKETVGGNLNLYTVNPYLRPIKRWINERQNSDGSTRQKHKQRQQRQFSQQNQNTYQEYMQIKNKGKAPKTPKSSKEQVRYSRDIIEEEKMQSKQGKKGMTVGESLFGSPNQKVEDFKPPDLDPKFFFSKALNEFKLDTDGIIALFEQPQTYYPYLSQSQYDYTD